MSKRITNSDLYHELGELSSSVKDMRNDLKEIGPRLRELETFRSYVKGGFAVISSLSIACFALIKGVFGHF